MFRGDNDVPVRYIEVVNSLRRCYDKAHELDTGPYGIEITKEESPAEFSLYGYWAKIYREERIKDHYGLTFDEFLARPRYKIEILLEQVKLINDKDSADGAVIKENIKTQLEKLSK